jgi:hypothetical protein
MSLYAKRLERGRFIWPSATADVVSISSAQLAYMLDGIDWRALYEMIKAHVFAAEHIHGDDTTVPVLAKLKTRIGRIWTYVRDDRPFGGEASPAAVFFYSPDRASIHPEQHLAGYCGILQADAYAGFNRLYQPERKPGPITEAGCWAHARRKLFELADVASNARDQRRPTISPIAFEAVQKFDAIFMLERSINGLSPEARVAARRKDIAPLVNASGPSSRVTTK